MNRNGLLKRLLTILSCVSLWCVATAASGVKTSGSQATKTNLPQMRKTFVEAFGADFDLLSDEVREKAGNKYWLATVRPKRSGNFVFRYKFRRINYSYKYSDNEFPIKVGDEGCSRTLSYGLRPDICLGDSLVVPISINDNLVNHTFTNVSRFVTADRSEFNELGGLILDRLQSENPTKAHLKYVGRTVRPSIERGLRYVQVSFQAVFEAVDMGSFELHMSPRLPAELREFASENPTSTKTPINIVASGIPITALAASEQVLESDEEQNPIVSSAGGRSYQTSKLTLRPGDQIILTYCMMRLPTSRGLEKLADEVEPIIVQRPFSVADSNSTYDEWLAKKAAP